MTLDKAPDASYKRALIKKLRQASAKLVELDAAGTSTVDAKTAAERRARAEETIARSLDALDAIGVRASDQEVVNARGSDARAASARDEKRRREGEARRLEDERRAKHARANRAIGKTVKSVSLWRLHSMAKNEGLGDEGEVSRAATETASDAERVDGKSCNAGMWAVAKLAKMVPEGQIGVEAYNGVVKALGCAMNALARRMVDMGEDAMDARAASTTIWSIATILKTKCAAHVDDALLRRAVSGAANRLNTCATTANAQDAANALWGAAKLRKMLHEQCVTALVHVLASGEVRTEEVSSSLWAIATFGGDGWKEAATYAEPLAKRAKDMAKKQPKDWNAQAVANAAWAAGKLATNDPNVELGDAKQLITLLIPIAKNLSLSAQGFAHVMYAAGAVVVDSRMLADCAKFASKGLKTHAATLTGADLAAVVEATHALKLGTSMSDGAQLKMAIINAIERGMGDFDWQTVGRLDFVIDDVFDDDEAQSIREKLNVRGTAVCEETDANRMHIERGSADALLAQELTAPFDELSARALIVDDKYRLITKRLRRVGWSVSNWQRFSCGDHGTGTSWPETPDEFYAAAMVRAPPTKASLAMILHAVAANVRFGGRIWIYGGITEGIRGVIADLPKVRHYRTRLLSSIGILPRAPSMRACEAQADDAKLLTGRDCCCSLKGPSNPERASSVWRIIMSLD